MTELDPKSADPVLEYVGPGAIAGIPADTLSANQIARAAWVGLGDKRPASPADITQKQLADQRDELIKTGLYKAAKPPKE